MSENPTPKRPSLNDLVCSVRKCPFCGSRPHVISERRLDFLLLGTWHCIRCYNRKCPIQPKLSKQKLKDAVTAWNGRNHAD